MVLTLVGVMKNYVPFGVGPERSEKRIRAFKEAAERLRGLGHTEIKSGMCSMKWWVQIGGGLLVWLVHIITQKDF